MLEPLPRQNERLPEVGRVEEHRNRQREDDLVDDVELRRVGRQDAHVGEEHPQQRGHQRTAGGGRCVWGRRVSYPVKPRRPLYF